MSISLVFETGNLEKVITDFASLADFPTGPLMDAIAAIGESQTRRRISEEKTGPDGTAWLPNAEGTSILLKTGRNLLDSVASQSSSAEAEWGAAWQYAHVHQEGAEIVPKGAEFLVFKVGGKTVRAKKVTIPARPFVGLSTDNETEIRDVVTDYLGSLIR
ncbi:phage virion morphogenesis protein [Hoeflea marina]|uniref:Phage virion morphogenesis protein n=1 Tax=Hoeflea marina TaxID=274592 RepID=A0A317PGD1_9HYPH|nr:phage virion morphogenesis protein [Hoeflea marina]PWV97711.1 phage virion morphogenesis protein [Hoeflea marina]